MDVTYEVSELFKLAFGVSSPVFIPYPITIDQQRPIQFKDSEKQQSQALNFPNVLVKEERTSDRLSWMGTPVIFPWTLKGGTYRKFDRTGELVDYQMEDFEMPAATLINFEQDKILTRTKLSGNVGTVKEMYGFDDWDGRVRGICLTDKSRKTAKTADEQKRELIKWKNLCTAIAVEGELFFEKDIMAISMGKITFTQLEGKPDVIPFEFQLFSDERQELIL